jgi:hypothetical protein
MANEAFNPSRCEIKTAKLIPYDGENKREYDVSLMIGNFRMSQSIEQLSLNGSIDILDNVGLLQNAPLRGEEVLRLTMYCYDLQTEVSLECQIYKIDGVEPTPDTKGASYTLHWISKASYEAGKRSVIRSYANKKASTIVQDIFNNYYGPDKNLNKASPQIFFNITPSTASEGEVLPENTKVFSLKSDKGRKVYIEESDNNMTVTIPDYMPTEAIGFVARRAFGSSRSKSSLFRFFETYKGFYFVSDEWLYAYGRANKPKALTYNPFVELDGAAPREQIETLSNFVQGQRVNVGAELAGGAYSNTVMEVDILKRTAKRFNYHYKDYYKEFKDVGGKTASLGSDIHTEKFMTDTFTKENAKQWMIIREYTDRNLVGAFRPETNFRDLAAKRNMFAFHAAATQISAVTTGRLDLQAGDIVKLNIKEMTAGNQSQNNKQLSGRYLIIAIENNIGDGELQTAMRLYKFGWSDAASDTKGGV